MPTVFECMKCGHIGHVVKKDGNRHEVVCDCGYKWTCHTPILEMSKPAQEIYDKAMKDFKGDSAPFVPDIWHIPSFECNNRKNGLCAHPDNPTIGTTRECSYAKCPIKLKGG